jgi:hypothetical protein
LRDEIVASGAVGSGGAFEADPQASAEFAIFQFQLAYFVALHGFLRQSVVAAGENEQAQADVF